MNTYVYYEGCGYESEPFRAVDNDAAEAHVLATFRSPSNVDFDGDEGGIIRIEHGGEGAEDQRVSVVTFDGDDMIADPFNQRQSYRGGA